MKTFFAACALAITGITFINGKTGGIYPLCPANTDTYTLFDTVPKNKQDSTLRLRDDSINKYRRDTFNRKDSFIKKRDSL